MNVSIALLGRAEIHTLRALAEAIWREHYPPIIGPEQTEYMLRQRYTIEVISAELERADIWWDTLKVDNHMIAFASSHAHTESTAAVMKLDKLYVHGRHQRKGYGGALIERACARARDCGMKAVALAVNKRNVSAIAAYRKHGFVVTDAVVKDIGDGFFMDDYLMERQL